MPRQFKAARQINELKATKATELLKVSLPTLSAWEGEQTYSKPFPFFISTANFLLK